MSDLRITVRRWSSDNDKPDISTYALAADDRWRRVEPEPRSAACTLEEIMFFDPDGAMHVETTGSNPPPAVLGAALPRTSAYLECCDEIETDDEVLDRNLGSGLRQVAINGQRWYPFPFQTDQPEAVVWLECDHDELERDRAIPSGVEIASAGGIETGSMTSGWFSWSLLDVGFGYVCFVSEPDEDSNTYLVEERQGRTNRELAEEFAHWVDWGPVSDAVVRAIELGGDFDGVASELHQRWSDSCEVSAHVDLSSGV